MRPGEMRIRTKLTLLLALAALSGCLSGGEQSNFNGAGKSGNSGSRSANNAPNISGSPPSAILVGDVLSFTPTSSDADGDSLVFSISNKPSWATFDTSTGRLSGQALLGDVGLYERIRISVSDGTATVTLREFSITVSQTALGSISLDWTPPLENADGSTLTDLAGYNIYYGTSPGTYPYRVRIDNPSINTYVIDNVVPNTYYVAATSFNSRGTESVFSNVITRVVTSD